MSNVSRFRAALLTVVAAACLVVPVATSATAAPVRPGGTSGAPIARLSLAGYVLNAAYTRGRDAGNTFQQTYKASTVHGVPIKGPFVGTKFPVEDYVALPIGNHEIYVAWLDTSKTHALLDVFVMNLANHKIYDYAPGSLHPESIGKVTVVKTGKRKLP
jgi:hypothetical protein